MLIEFDKRARKRLGKKIREGRNAQKLTQGKLGRQLGYRGSQFVSNWERGAALPPREAISGLICLDIISETWFKNFCIENTKKSIKDIISGA